MNSRSLALVSGQDWSWGIKGRIAEPTGGSGVPVGRRQRGLRLSGPGLSRRVLLLVLPPDGFILISQPYFSGLKKNGSNTTSS